MKLEKAEIIELANCQVENLRQLREERTQISRLDKAIIQAHSTLKEKEMKITELHNTIETVKNLVNML